MKIKSLEEIYKSVNAEARTIYVVPLIRYSHKKTDYLYLLYQDLIEGSLYKIKSISVLNHFELILRALINKNVILHYHWLEFQDLKSLLGMPWKLLCIFLFKFLGGNLVWTLHNEFPHDQKYLKLHHYLHKKVATISDALHVHCEEAKHKMSHKLEVSEQKFHLVPHPQFPPIIIPKSEAISNLNEHFDCHIEKEVPVLLMFGNISRYKQIVEAAQLVERLETECRLLVVGPVKKGNMDLFKELMDMESINKTLKVIPRFIKEEQVPWFYNAADICIFNYREILSSGGFHMADAYHKTIIAPKLGCLSEKEKQSNVYLFENQEEFKLLLNQQLKS